MLASSTAEPSHHQRVQGRAVCVTAGQASGSEVAAGAVDSSDWATDAARVSRQIAASESPRQRAQLHDATIRQPLTFLTTAARAWDTIRLPRGQARR